MEDLRQRVSCNLREYVKKLRFRNNDLAKYLEVDASTVSKYLSGDRNIPIVSLQKMSTLLGIELIDLFEEDVNSRNVKLKCAFRADSEGIDFDAVSFLKEKALNYLNMKKMLQE